MKRNLFLSNFYIINILIILLLSGCSRNVDIPLPLENLVNKNAYDLIKYKSKNGKRTQISYSVHLRYPDRAINDKYFGYIEKQGWIACNRYSKSWDHFKDSSKSKKMVVHRYLLHWVKKDKLLTINMEYRSDFDNKNQKNILEPNNNEQRVIILIDNYNNADQLRLVKNKLGLICKKLKGVGDK